MNLILLFNLPKYYSASDIVIDLFEKPSVKQSDEFLERKISWKHWPTKKTECIKSNSKSDLENYVNEN